MMPNLNRVLSETLALPTTSLVWELSRRLVELFPHRHILETEDYDFDLTQYEADGQCSVFALDDVHLQVDTEWINRSYGIQLKPRNAFLEVQWRGHKLNVLSISYNDGCDNARRFIVADREDVARDFFEAVCSHTVKVQGQILVFRHGVWVKDADLLKQIESARLDDLVLPDGLRDSIVHDFESFFASKELYDQLGVAWKRGILFLGPPGNGKTHALKAIVQRLKVPCLYVRSFKSERASAQRNVEKVFERAREAAPCLLVLEDLDSLIDPKWLSFFLNEMDGFAANRGILTVGTTNHPDRLDPALLERPSRFDRKVTFPLPEQPQRQAFLANLDARRDARMQLSEADLIVLSEATEGFSVAFLKELHLSATMAWMRDQVPGSMGQVSLNLVPSLRTQLQSMPAPSPESPEEDEDDEG